MNRRTCMTGFAAALLTTLGACKRQRAPRVDEVWDEPLTVEATDASALAPPWTAPTRAVLDSGLATFWLHEPEAPVFHVRLLIPTIDAQGEGPSLAASLVVVEHVQQVLTRRLSALGVAVAVEHGTDRFEVSVAGPTDDATPILHGIAAAFDPHTPTNVLSRARTQLSDRTSAVAADEAAIAGLVAKLLARPLEAQRLDPGALRALPDDVLGDAWRLLSDPRRAVLIVHAGQSADAMKDALHGLSDRWHGLGRRTLAPSAVARLRAPAAKVGGDTRLLAAPAAPIEITPAGTTGGPVLVLGRLLPTESVQARSMARLAQRIAAEEVDARLVLAGTRAVLVVRVPLSPVNPDGSATKAVDILSLLARTRQPQQRLAAAAQLWLGARVVQASLDGEDWTALWSEAMDLAQDDDTIANALARDAEAMLATDPQALKVWQERWLDPRGGEGGWSWTVASADDTQLRRLARIAPVAGLDAPPR